MSGPIVAKKKGAGRFASGWRTTMSHSFNSAASSSDFGPLTYPWAGDGRVTVVTDPTGVLDTKCVRCEYVITAGNSYDSDRALFYLFTSSSEWATYGESIAVQYKFVIPSGTAAADSTNMRKLMYLRTAAAGSTADGTANGCVVPREQDGVLTVGWNNNGVDTNIPGGSTVTITRDVAHTLRVELTVNSADGVYDGSIYVYYDGALVKSTTTACLLFGGSGTVSGTPYRYYAMGFGYQFQGTAATSPSTEYRYWDDPLTQKRP